MKKLLLIVGVLFGCATQYQPMGSSGGYSDIQIDQNTFSVEFKGNGFTERQKVEMALLRRCAEVTIEHGYDYFIILNKEDDSRQETVTTPGRFNSSTYGDQNYSSSSGTFTPGQTIHFTKHGALATIKAFKGEKPENNLNAYNAHELVKYLGDKQGENP